MTKTELLKPFTKTTHTVIWTVYLLWITVINVRKYGEEHLPLVLVSFVLMLSISYLNRYLLRTMLFHPLSFKWIVIALLPFLVLMIVVYLWIYYSPGRLSVQLLPERRDYGFADFAVDYTNFYWSFGWKGIGLGLLEIMANILRRLIHIFTIQRKLEMQGRALTARERYIERQETIRRWVGHFLGNMAQGIRRSALYTTAPDQAVPVLNRLWSYGVRMMLGKGAQHVPLASELDGVKQLSHLYADRDIRIQWPEDTFGHQVVPMTLMAPFKNMVKHGHFGPEVGRARFDIMVDQERLILKTENAIAAHAAWIYEEGGTGLEQLEHILQQYSRGNTRIEHWVHDGRFGLLLTISFTD